MDMYVASLIKIKSWILNGDLDNSVVVPLSEIVIVLIMYSTSSHMLLGHVTSPTPNGQLYIIKIKA